MAMDISCSVCNKMFTKTRNLVRHCNEQHGDTNSADGECKLTVQCDLCGKLFKRLENLQKHMDAIHGAGDRKQCSFCSYATVRKSALIQHIRTVHKNSESVKKMIEMPFLCHICSKGFRLRKHLNFHLRRKHDLHNCLGDVKSVRKNCPLCPFVATHQVGSKVNDMMYDHFKIVHDLSLIVENIKFDSVDEFDCWKINLEEVTSSKFIKSDRHTANSMRFVCNRSGYFKSKGTGKRRMKFFGSCKINGFCPAVIVAKLQFNGAVDVSFLNTHVGHKDNPAPNKITSSRSFEESKEIFAQELLMIVKNDVTNFEELEAVQDQCKYIVPILDSIKAQATADSSDGYETYATTIEHCSTPHQTKFVLNLTNKESKVLTLHDEDEIAVKLLEEENYIN